MSEITAPVNLSQRYRQLDSLRGLAALFVLFSHYFLIFKDPDVFFGYLKMSPLGLLVNGRPAVMFFFVLSGFVLSQPFLNGNKPIYLTAFYLKRIFRIYPAFILAVLISLLLKIYFYDNGGMYPFSNWLKGFWQWDLTRGSYLELFKTMLLIGPFFNAEFIIPVIWSLIVEMQMSLILPFFIMIAYRNNLVFNAVFIFIIIFLVYYHQPQYLGIFYLGILCAKYKHFLISKVKHLNKGYLLLLLAFSIFLCNIHFEFVRQYKTDDKYFYMIFFIKDYLAAFGGCIILIIALARVRVANLLKNKIFLFIGDISYSIYLVHLPILITVCSVFHQNSMVSNSCILIVTIIVSFIISTIIFKFIEIPAQIYAKKMIGKLNFLNKFDIASN